LVSEAAAMYGFPIGVWNVSQVTDFSGLFSEFPQFNEFIGNWDTSSVLDMSFMFQDAQIFNQGESMTSGSKISGVTFLSHAWSLV
jgi:hypothetical protein